MSAITPYYYSALMLPLFIANQINPALIATGCHTNTPLNDKN